MSEGKHTEGTLEYSIHKDTGNPATLFIHVENDELDIATFEVWDNAQQEMITNVEFLCNAWNSHAQVQEVIDGLVEVCEAGKRFRKAHNAGNVDPDSAHDYFEWFFDNIEAALAAAKELK